MNYKTKFIAIKDLPPAESFLTEREADYIKTLKAPKRKTDWLGGRFVLKALAAEALNWTDLKRLEVEKLASGAPKLYADGQPVPWSVSITHSNGLAAAAFAREGLIGIDLEKIENRSAAWAAEFFTAGEKLRADAAFLTELWTRKEAVVKLLGTGLMLNTREITFEGGALFLSGRAEHIWRDMGRPSIHFQTHRLADDFVFTAAFAGGAARP